MSRRHRRRKSKHMERTTREAVNHFFTSLYQIAKIGYAAAPKILVVTMGIRIVQSVLPVASAYVFKLIIDELGVVLSGESTVGFEDYVLPLVLIFGVIMLMTQVLGAINSYLQSEMGRRLEIHMSQLVYSHLLSLKGMHFFESPGFHDTLRQAQRLDWMPSQFINQASRVFSSVLTLLSFFGIVFVFSPVLAIILVCATIPSFLSQLRFLCISN